MIHRGRSGSDRPLTDFCYPLRWQSQPFQKALVTFRVLRLEQPVPILHRRIIQADHSESFDPLFNRNLAFHLLLLSSRILYHGRQRCPV